MELCIKARVREESGKNANRQIRQGGEVPANLVMPSQNKSMVLATPLADVRTIAKNRARKISVEIEGVGVKEAFVSDIVWDNLKDRFLHLDLIEVEEGKKNTVKVPLIVTGDAEVRSRGGIFVFYVDHVEVCGYASDIPERIRIDASKLQLGDFVTVADLKITDKVEIIPPLKLRVCEARATKAVISREKSEEAAEEEAAE